MKRQRATVIVEIDRRILLVENRGGLVLLPGGGIDPQESRLQAVARELVDETGLIAESLVFLFDHESPSHDHHVFLAAARGTPVAGDDAMVLHFHDRDDPSASRRMTQATREIIGHFLARRVDEGLAFPAWRC